MAAMLGAQSEQPGQPSRAAIPIIVAVKRGVTGMKANISVEQIRSRTRLHG